MCRTISTKNSSFDQGCIGRLLLIIRRLIRDVSDNLECVGRLILGIRRLTMGCVG